MKANNGVPDMPRTPQKEGLPKQIAGDILDKLNTVGKYDGYFGGLAYPNICPNCGYCPHCGRGGSYPWWNKPAVWCDTGPNVVLC